MGTADRLVAGRGEEAEEDSDPPRVDEDDEDDGEDDEEEEEEEGGDWLVDWVPDGAGETLRRRGHADHPPPQAGRGGGGGGNISTVLKNSRFWKRKYLFGCEIVGKFESICGKV